MKGSRGDCKMNQTNQPYPMPVYHQQNEIDMNEGAGGVKRGQKNLRKIGIMISGGSVKGSRGDCKIFLMYPMKNMKPAGTKEFKSKNGEDQ